jgi:hypothetical protein
MPDQLCGGVGPIVRQDDQKLRRLDSAEFVGAFCLERFKRAVAASRSCSGAAIPSSPTTADTRARETPHISGHRRQVGHLPAPNQMVDPICQRQIPRPDGPPCPRAAALVWPQAPPSARASCRPAGPRTRRVALRWPSRRPLGCGHLSGQRSDCGRPEGDGHRLPLSIEVDPLDQ